MDPDGAALTVRRSRRAGAKWRRLGVFVVLAVPPVAFVITFFAWPVATLLIRAFTVGSDVPGPAGILADPLLWRTAWFTAWQAAVSTLLTLVFGMPVAAVVARYRFRGRSLLEAATTTAFVLPTVVVGAAFAGVLPKGVFAILVAHVFFNLAVVVRVVGGAWRRIDPRPAYAARCLGAGPVRVFTTVTLPMLRPALTAAAALVFLFTFSSFGVVLVLGGPTVNTLETGVWRLATQQFRLDAAAVWALVQVVVASSVVLVFGARSRGTGIDLRATGSDVECSDVRTPFARVLVGVAVVVVVGLLAVPVFELVRRSIDTGTGATAAGWRSVVGLPPQTGPQVSIVSSVDTVEAVWNSMWIAATTVVIACGLGLAVATLAAGTRSLGARLTDASSIVPLATSSVIVGFGMLLAYNALPVDVLGSRLLLPAAHSVIALPFVVAVLTPAMRAVDPTLRDAASTLGASPVTVYRDVDLPAVARSFAVAAGFAACISLGEFGATAFLVRPDTTTMPVAVFRLLGRPGALNQTTASALAVLLLVLTAATTFAVDRLAVRRA